MWLTPGTHQRRCVLVDPAHSGHAVQMSRGALVLGSEAVLDPHHDAVCEESQRAGDRCVHGHISNDESAPVPASMGM